MVAVCLAAIGSYGYASILRQFRTDLVGDGNDALAVRFEIVRAWLDRYRILSPVYAHDPRMIAALEHPDDPARISALDRELEIWNAVAGTADTYVMDSLGTTIASSNAQDADSFVGRNFAFRPYFQQAAEGRLGRFFALGTTSGERGYYFASPVRSPHAVIGAVAVKVPVDGIEQDLRLGPEQVFITDAAGVVILSGNPALRLTALGEISASDRDRIAATRQFDLHDIPPAPVQPAGSWLNGTYETVRAPADRTEGREAEFLHLTRPMNAEGWVLHVLIDTASVRARAGWAAIVVVAGLVTAAAVLGLFWQRRRRLIDRLRERERAQAELEQRVADRTVDLSDANMRLRSEVAERKAAEDTLRRTQSELVQAGKLAALGQMSAALSHEFNQPLTAIRSYSENAVAFIEAGAGGKAAENLSRVLRLTERMAQLSKHLTRFARRSQDTINTVSLDDTIDETLALLQGRIERAEARVSRHGLTGLRVLGGQVRLQHVFMNLIGNALDAVPAGMTPVIDVTISRQDGAVRIAVEDNGSGIPDAVLPQIFDPFFTTKEVGRGLGLGLSISFNIVTDFGGSMRAENREGGGARMIVVLQEAEAPAKEAAE